MILPDDFESMTEDEIVADLVGGGLDRETAEAYARVVQIPEEWLEENGLFLM